MIPKLNFRERRRTHFETEVKIREYTAYYKDRCMLCGKKVLTKDCKSCGPRYLNRRKLTTEQVSIICKLQFSIILAAIQRGDLPAGRTKQHMHRILLDDLRFWLLEEGKTRELKLLTKWIISPKKPLIKVSNSVKNANRIMSASI